MWTPTEHAWKVIRSWNVEEHPFIAVEDYSEFKKELRWLNPDHRQLWEEIILKRLEFIKESESNFENYYKASANPIARDRWEYLTARKAWYIMPLGWEHFLERSCKIIDLGCGDGDTIQRIIHYIQNHFKKENITDRKVHLVGLDLNPTRVENAKKLVQSPNSNITFEFDVADITGKGLQYKDDEFDFAVSTAVLEVLDGGAFNFYMNEMCRVARRGIYVEDLSDQYPGGFPRTDLPDHFKQRNFKVTHNHYIFNQPFDVASLRDPLKMFPIMLVQNLWAEKVS